MRQRNVSILAVLTFTGLAACGSADESGSGAGAMGAGATGASDATTTAMGGSSTTTSSDGSGGSNATGGAAGSGGCTADLQTSATHCGACGHDCLGGTCVAGSCQPVVLATQQAAPYRLALDDTSLYWTDGGLGTTNVTGGAVMKVPLSGGAPAALLTNPPGSYFGIAVDATRVYVSIAPASAASNSYIEAIPKAGGVATALHTGPGASWFAVGLTTDAPANGSAANVYWSDLYTAMVYSVAAAGGTAKAFAGVANAEGVTYDGGVLYFCDAGTFDANYNPNYDGRVVMKLATASGGGTPLVLGGEPIELAVDGTDVYYTDYQGSVKRVPKQGGAPETLAAAAYPVAIALDANYAYWTERGAPKTACVGAGSIKRMPKAGGSIETLASGQTCLSGIAVDTSAVYWTELGTTPFVSADGTVKKVAK